MIPRPIFKWLVVPVWPLVVLASFWLWAKVVDQPKQHYLWTQSGFLYERLWLPRFPTWPGSKPEPEKWKVLAYACPTGLCLATTEELRAGRAVIETDFPAPRETVRAILSDKVYHGSATGALWFPLVVSAVSLPALIVAGFLLDFRRRKRLMHGIQIEGRLPVAVEAFTDLLDRLRNGSVRINVEKVRGRTSALK